MVTVILTRVVVESELLVTQTYFDFGSMVLQKNNKKMSFSNCIEKKKIDSQQILMLFYHLHL